MTWLSQEKIRCRRMTLMRLDPSLNEGKETGLFCLQSLGPDTSKLCVWYGDHYFQLKFHCSVYRFYNSSE